MSQHPIALLIEKADKAINQEDFDTIAFWIHNGWSAPTWQVMQKTVDA